MLRKDLEDQIAAKLVSLSNEDAQRIAEEFVRIQYPERFPYFGFRAFSPEGKSRPGWPDASSVGIDGKLEGVEATHTANRAGVIGHLNEYLKKATTLQSDRLAGFLHVSVSPKVSFLPQEINDWTEKFVKAGFQPGRVELVFGQGLVEILTRPEFARTRIEVLGIQDLPTHFRLYRSEVGPDENRLGTSFIPNWEDFEKGRIHRSEIAEDVTEKLSCDRVALVRGIGASGKTVLAWLLAQDVVKQGLPAFFFDLAADTNPRSYLVNGLISDVKRFAHPQVLFVLDNIHVEETSAKELFIAWKEIPLSQRPRLLLVGRETRTAKGSAIDSLNIDALPLRARQAELRGVFRRLALREYSDDQLHEPPEAELTNWLSTFGGKPDNPETTADLIVFSAAVVRRIGDLRRGRWQLTEQDAVEQVRVVYLKKLSPPELANLIRLCVAQQLELGMLNDALVDKIAALTTCNEKLGIVFRDEIGNRKRYVRYRLVHPALGELLLSGTEEAVDNAGILLEMALASPMGGQFTARRLMYAGKLEDAKAIILGLFNKPASFLLYDNLLYIEMFLRLADRLEIQLPENFNSTLAAEGRKRSRLTEIALQTPLHSLTSFLRYAEKKLPEIFGVLKTVLADKRYHRSVVNAALSSPLHLLANFLRYANEELLEVSEALKEELERKENFSDLVKIALNTPLHLIAHFLSYAKEELPELFESLKTELETKENLADLVEIALNTPLHLLANFLRYAEEELLALSGALKAELERKENLADLVKLALDTPLHLLANFLRYAEEELPALSGALKAEFERKENLADLVKAALDTPLGDLANFLRYVEEQLPELFQALKIGLAEAGNRPKLVGAALNTPLHFLQSFLSYAEEKMPELFTALKTELEMTGNRAHLVNAARSSLHSYVSGFQNYVETSMPILFKELSTELNLPVQNGGASTV